jgi:hypothetical protein
MCNKKAESHTGEILSALCAGCALGGSCDRSYTHYMCLLRGAGEFEKGDSTLEQIYVHIPFLHTSASATGKVKLYDALIPRAIFLDN